MELSRIHAGPRLSQVVVAGEWIFLSGQVAADPSESVTGQTRQILAQIDSLLADAGSSSEHLVSVNIYLADVADFAEVNSIWDAWVAEGASPARATIGARLAAPNYRVEIQAIAVSAQSRGTVG